MTKTQVQDQEFENWVLRHLETDQDSSLDNHNAVNTICNLCTDTLYIQQTRFHFSTVELPHKKNLECTNKYTLFTSCIALLKHSAISLCSHFRSCRLVTGTHHKASFHKAQMSYRDTPHKLLISIVHRWRCYCRVQLWFQYWRFRICIKIHNERTDIVKNNNLRKKLSYHTGTMECTGRLLKFYQLLKKLYAKITFQ